MKKLFILALCAAAVGGASAQKANVDAAKKLAGKVDKITDARNAIKEAMANPETMNEPNTYVVAADIELKAYDKLKKDLGLNTQNAEPAKLAEMDQYLLNAYPLIQKIAELSANDPKGKAIGEAQNRAVKYVNDYFQAGADMFNSKNYPQAYEAFMAYGDLPSMSFVQGKIAIPDSVRATSYYNAGLSGWSIPDLKKAAAAFKASRLAGYSDPQAYIYELACWQHLMQNDSTLTAEGQQDIFETSKDGYARFGLSQPVFLNNMINVLVEQNKETEAIAELNKLIAAKEGAALYGLRGFVYDRMDKDDESEADYRKAASMADADFETLVNAGKKIFRLGTERWNKIEGTSPESLAERKTVRENYFQAAKDIATKAQSIKKENDNANGLDYLIEQVDYALETFK